MANILNLPAEIYLHICEFLSIKDIIILTFTHKSILRKLSDKLHNLYHECIIEIENNWNDLVPEAEYKAKRKLDKYKSEVCSGWEVTKSYQFECSIYPWKIHWIKVIYVHNPIDIDLLAWYLEDKKMGYTML